MCNDYGNRIRYSAYLEAFSHLKIRLVVPGGAPNLEPRDDIWPNRMLPLVIRARERRCGACPTAVGVSPWAAKGPTVINMCIARIGASHVAAAWCPYRTSMNSPGSDHRRTNGDFHEVDEDWFCIAGLWRPVSRGGTPAFTMSTCEPGPDVAPIHNRQIVVLDRSKWGQHGSIQTLQKTVLLKPSPCRFFEGRESS